VSDPKASGSTVARSVRPLDVDTWPAFARLVEANNGVWGGCWCMGFHAKVGKGRTSAQNRADKEQRVAESRTHASLVLDRDECLGWCQFGSAEELPEIKSRRRYEKDLTTVPDWRITCFFTGKGLHGRGLPRGDRRPHAVGLVPAHRADGRLREPRLHAHAADLAAPLGRHPDCRPGLTSPAQASTQHRCHRHPEIPRHARHLRRRRPKAVRRTTRQKVRLRASTPAIQGMTGVPLEDPLAMVGPAHRRPPRVAMAGSQSTRTSTRQFSPGARESRASLVTNGASSISASTT